MSEIKNAKFWVSGWLQLFAFRDISARMWRRVTWAGHRHELARRAENKHYSGPRCSFCEMAGHDESQTACPDRIWSAAEYVSCGAWMYPRTKGGAE